MKIFYNLFFKIICIKLITTIWYCRKRQDSNNHESLSKCFEGSLSRICILRKNSELHIIVNIEVIVDIRIMLINLNKYYLPDLSCMRLQTLQRWSAAVVVEWHWQLSPCCSDMMNSPLAEHVTRRDDMRG